jgi:hypothetical protein
VAPTLVGACPFAAHPPRSVVRRGGDCTRANGLPEVQTPLMPMPVCRLRLSRGSPPRLRAHPVPDCCTQCRCPPRPARPGRWTLVVPLDIIRPPHPHRLFLAAPAAPELASDEPRRIGSAVGLVGPVWLPPTIGLSARPVLALGRTNNNKRPAGSPWTLPVAAHRISAVGCRRVWAPGPLRVCDGTRPTVRRYCWSERAAETGASRPWTAAQTWMSGWFSSSQP